MKLFLAFTGIFFCLQASAQEQNDMDSVKYYIRNSQPARALPLAKKNFEAAKVLSDVDSVHIYVTAQLGDIYYSLVKPDSALVYYVKACEGAKNRYGETSRQYGKLLVNVAIIYKELGQFEQAGQAFQYATTILKETESSGKGAYVRCLVHYAVFYSATGNLNKAEELCRMGIEIARTEPVDQSTYTSALVVQASIYEKLGLYEKQEALIFQVFEMRKQIYGEKHPVYASALVQLASVYERRQNLPKADSMYREALEICEQEVGKNSSANIYLLRRIGRVNIEMGKYDVAEEYLGKSMEIINEDGGKESSLYTICANSLARLYVLSGRKALAESFYQKSLAIYNRQGQELHAARLNLLHDMAALLYAEAPDKAAIYLQEAMITENKMLLEKLDFLSETELLAYLKSAKDGADSPYRFLQYNKNPEITGLAYNNRLLISGVGLQNTRVLYQNMTQSKDSTLTLLWKDYLQQKSFYTSLLLTPAAQRNADADSAAAILNQQEKDILRRSAEYRNMKEQLAITWQDIRKHLQPGETAVEFVKFNSVYTGIKTDSAYYAALLLRPGDTAPQFVLLCGEDQLIAAMKKFPYKAALNTRGKKAVNYQPNVTNVLYQLLWQPLESYLTDTRTVYFSPAGLLHRVAFAAMPAGKDALLCDRYDLVQLTSTRQVALQEARTPAPVSIAMFGGINYSRSTDTGVQVFADPYAWVYRENRSADLDSFSFLPHTLKEIQAINTNTETLQKRSVVFTAGNATEAAFRSLGGDSSPEVIHFATHGFTLPDDTSTGNGNAGMPFKSADNPLLRCGLVMAGGNRGWKGEAEPNGDDGILTGLEISAVQLPNTQLAVLSACETGLGKIEGSEGVFGLQRAFKLAGVNYVITSLWQVPDKETAEFMETFYGHWLNGKTIRDAFLHTQKTMRYRYAPYYWAGFTLVQ